MKGIRYADEVKGYLTVGLYDDGAPGDPGSVGNAQQVGFGPAREANDGHG